MTSSKIKQFEQDIKLLEAIVQRMDSEEITLEKALDDFQSGVALIKNCEQAINAAQQTVNKLIDKLALPTNDNAPESNADN